MRKEPQHPRLLAGWLTGRVYVSTEYEDLGDGRFVSEVKYDVTDDFINLATQWADNREEDEHSD